MNALQEIKESLLHLLFPHVCAGCGSDHVDIKNFICMRCMHELPFTGFEKVTDNPVEKIFWGRLPIVSATAQFYFTKDSVIQRLMHQFKYKGSKDIGYQLGKMMAESLAGKNRFNIDALVPMPLFPSREKKRGYNQATLICRGMGEVLGVPILDKVITRPEHTETQTKKSRVERWKNIDGKFYLADPESIKYKHLLLVDDVITTGATLESCGQELLKGENTRLSVAALCFASH
jgi:ComF family protein